MSSSKTRFELLFNSAAFIRALRFIGVGGAATITYWAVVLIFAGFRILNPSIASVLAYAAGFCVAYCGHRHITYRSDRPVGAELRRFLTVHAACFTLGNLAFWYVVSWLGESYLLAGLALTATSFIITYIASEFWIFQTSFNTDKSET